MKLIFICLCSFLHCTWVFLPSVLKPCWQSSHLKFCCNTDFARSLNVAWRSLGSSTSKCLCVTEICACRASTPGKSKWHSGQATGSIKGKTFPPSSFILLGEFEPDVGPEVLWGEAEGLFFPDCEANTLFIWAKFAITEFGGCCVVDFMWLDKCCLKLPGCLNVRPQCSQPRY